MGLIKGKTNASVPSVSEDTDAFVFVVHRQDEYRGAKGWNQYIFILVLERVLLSWTQSGAAQPKVVKV